MSTAVEEWADACAEALIREGFTNVGGELMHELSDFLAAQVKVALASEEEMTAEAARDAAEWQHDKEIAEGRLKDAEDRAEELDRALDAASGALDHARAVLHPKAKK